MSQTKPPNAPARMIEGGLRWTPDPAALDAPITQTENVYLIGHFGLADVPAEGWALRVDGMVNRPLRLTLNELRALPAVTVTAVLECYGNPLRPDEPVRRAANVRWRGVPVRDLLAMAGADPGADSLWARGLDFGRFGDWHDLGYLKDVPLEVVAERGLVAYEMNGAPLTPGHGFPARLFVPGYFGTNNVKWLDGLTIAAGRPVHPFTTQLYQRERPGSAEPVPVREIDVNSLVTGHARTGGKLTVSGWAWGAAPVTRVEIGVGDRWLPASLELREAGRFDWQRFTLDLDPATPRPGELRITARATDALGATQPLGVARNQAHTITLPG